ncbi:peptidoglycan recognition protein family protein [Streptomyces flavofungini]|uniref:peptidoglycan recognition protein family protein n=1 Tax=Streptomyces flavofungini TaxID=68200 RepID=UPI0025AFD2ED|nr:N-acetylmuramoyl-L-alanine amidase [Streptomyces flavofungini]WJV45579.1 N-acetylmuramoyl-L-alanine amidase [Streptomyces flavofungini]
MAPPLSAGRLLTALRAEGCTVREVRSWRTNNRNHVGAWSPVNGVMIHHTVTGPGTDVVNLIYDGYRGLPGPLALGCITKDGVVHLTGNGRANHAGGGDLAVLRAVIAENYGDYPPPPRQHQGSPGAVDGNARFYGFECENRGDGRDPWPRVQYIAMVKAAAAVIRAYGWTAKSAIGHLEWSDWKVDPRGFDMKDYRRDLAACLAQPAGRWPDQEDTDMPTTFGRYDTTARPLRPGQWTTVPIEAENLLTGAAAIDALVQLTLENVPVGATLQGRFYHRRTDGSRWTAGITERQGTDGKTFVDFPHTGSIKPAESLHFEAVYWPLDPADTAPVTVTAARARGLYWS